jgi:hypothetical protein
VLGKQEEARSFSLSARLWIILKKHAPHCFLPRHVQARGIGYSASPAAVAPGARWLRDQSRSRMNGLRS